MKLIKVILILAIGLGIFRTASGQDTLTIEPFTSEGELNLVKAILGDTTESGERLNLNRVYRLKRGAIYLMDQTIFADFPIRMVSEIDPSKRPAMLVRGRYPTGDPIKTFFTFTKDGLSHSFKDIIFNGVDEDRQYLTQWNRGLKIAGNDINLDLKGCIMNAWAGLFLEITGDNASLYMRDCKWRNGVGGQSPPWGAQQTIFFSKYIKNLIVTNNTFFNTGGFWLFHEDGLAENVVIEHNTLFTSAIDLLRMRDLSNALVRSNIFYGTHAYGQKQSELLASWFDKDNQVISIFSLDTTSVDLLKSKGLKESDKRVLLTNNAYFSPKILVDWWDANSNLNKPVWMHSRTQGMFNDDQSYPNLVERDNVNKDPNFNDTEMDDWVVTELVKYCDNVRKSKSFTNRNYDAFKGITDVLMVPWPLPEDLTYSDQDLLIGGHDGLPVGDLNWFPTEKLKYNEGLVNVDDLENIKYELAISVFPNPVDDCLYISSNKEVKDQVLNTTIIDITGKILARENSLPDMLQFKDYNTGIYILKILTINGDVSFKIFKM
ncbi:MAG: T9SS type A sorting domain-containing protein [Saprospiraceae bacterium]